MDIRAEVTVTIRKLVRGRHLMRMRVWNPQFCQATKSQTNTFQTMVYNIKTYILQARKDKHIYKEKTYVILFHTITTSSTMSNNDVTIFRFRADMVRHL